MFTRCYSLLIALSLLAVTHLRAEDAKILHPFLCCDHNGGQVCVVNTDGTIAWRMEAKSPQDCWKLPNGNILFCHRGGAIEADAEKKIVWEYKAPANVECHACQPLPNGNVMVAEGGTSRLVEVDREGKIAKDIKFNTATKATHEQVRGARKTADGHYLLCLKGEHKVVELDGEGKQLKEIPVPGDVHEVLLLPDKHLLITTGEGRKLIELDETGKSVWEVGENDIPGNQLRLLAGIMRLPNGNTVVCNYLGHGFIGKQPQFFEITKDKKLVWDFSGKGEFKTINQIQFLDVPGDVTKGEVLR